MSITIDTVATFSLGGFVGYLIRTLIDHFLAKGRAAEDREARRFDEALTTFRRAILTELEGIYPVTQTWSKSIYPQFRQSITKVERAAAEFRPFVKHKEEFDTAIEEYRNYCDKGEYERASGWYMYPDMRKPGDVGPVESFKSIVERGDGRSTVNTSMKVGVVQRIDALSLMNSSEMPGSERLT